MTLVSLPYPPGLPIGSEWRASAQSVAVRFPFDGSHVADAPVGSCDDARLAVDEALGVKAATAGLASHLRREVLMSTYQAIADQRGEFESLLVLETGKPLVDCRTEVTRALTTLAVAAEEVAHLHGETVPLDLLPSGEGLIGFWTRVPIGVVVGIAGFNYPLLLAAHKIAPAFAAGCPVICKPAPQTPLATLWLVHLMRQQLARVGAPVAAVALVTGDASVGATLTTDRRIGAVSFTGSAAVGHQIARDAAPTKTLLELGANSALVVCSDADLDAAAAAVARGGFYASGQACISVQRVIVLADVAAEFTNRLVARMAEVTVGDPRDEKTRVSALIDQAAAERVRGYVEDARRAGARIEFQGHADGSCLGPTVLSGVPTDASAWAEEIFGPVVCLATVASVQEAFDLVNRSRYGLHASVFTHSLDIAFAALRQLEVGGVVVNDVPGFRADNMPYGGVKDSGIGREGPRFAMEELTVTRMAVIRASGGAR